MAVFYGKGELCENCKQRVFSGDWYRFLTVWSTVFKPFLRVNFC